MLEEINVALETYEQKWQKLIAVRHDRGFFAGLQPTSVAWKVTDRAEFDSRLTNLKDLCDQIHLGWVNERWLATLHLKDTALANGCTVIKLMERRPGSTDPVGLDHIDFLLPPNQEAKSLLSSETDLEWSEEFNGNNCKWLSIWFAQTEAKLRTDTVLQVCADELLETQQNIVDEIN